MRLFGILSLTTVLAVLASAAPPPVTVPGLPRITLNWQDTSDNETGFQIWGAVGATGEFVVLGWVDQNVTTFSNSNLEYATTYRYRVRAYSATALSPFSPTASAVTPDAPVTPNAPTSLNLIVEVPAVPVTP